jgi:F420H(2)-dependent quinone reductase
MQQVKPRPEGLDKPWVPTLIKRMGRANVWVYQKSGGRLWGRWYLGGTLKKGGIPICLLTTTGRKSGLPRVAPLLFLEDGSRVIIVASQGGLPTNPQWFYNVVANPDCSVQVRREVREMRARVTDGAERVRLWGKLVEMYADFASYQSWTDREIPVVVLEPVAGA